jgi:hypothetical protein
MKVGPNELSMWHLRRISFEISSKDTFFTICPTVCARH